MSERKNDHRALIPYTASYPVQVQAAGRQLSIASQLNQDIERGRFVAILKKISSKDAAYFLSKRQALDGDLVERYADRWNWEWLTANKELTWTIELIARYADRWDWDDLSRNEDLPWSIELVDRFEDRWNWLTPSAVCRCSFSGLMWRRATSSAAEESAWRQPDAARPASDTQGSLQAVAVPT